MRPSLASRLLLLCGLAALIAGSRAAADEPGPDDPWQPPSEARREVLLRRAVGPGGPPGTYRAVYGSYVVKSDVGAGFALDCAVFLDRFERQFRFLLGGRTPARRPNLCIVHKEEATYRLQFDDGSRGFYLDRTQTLYTYLDAAKGETDWASFYKPIVLHEATHQMLRQTIGTTSLPVWFDEGLAAYFQLWDVRSGFEENQARLAQAHYGTKEMAAAWKAGTIVPLSRLFRLSRAEWAPDAYGERTKVHYAEAASVVALLLQSREGRARFKRIYDQVRAGEDAREIARVHAPALDDAWEAWLKERFEAAEEAPSPTPPDR